MIVAWIAGDFIYLMYTKSMKFTVEILFWNRNKATSLVAEILEEFLYDIEYVLLIPACDREFEVGVNGENIFSKNMIGRHGYKGEILNKIRGLLK